MQHYTGLDSRPEKRGREWDSCQNFNRVYGLNNCAVSVLIFWLWLVIIISESAFIWGKYTVVFKGWVIVLQLVLRKRIIIYIKEREQCGKMLKIRDSRKRENGRRLQEGERVQSLRADIATWHTEEDLTKEHLSSSTHFHEGLLLTCGERNGGWGYLIYWHKN